MAAVRGSNIESVKMLLKLGANPNIKDTQGKSLLVDAIAKVEQAVTNGEKKGTKGVQERRRKLEEMKLILDGYKQ